MLYINSLEVCNRQVKENPLLHLQPEYTNCFLASFLAQFCSKLKTNTFLWDNIIE